MKSKIHDPGFCELAKQYQKKCYMMSKRIISLLTLFFLFNSCTPDSDTYLFELLPIQSVELPTEFTLGQTYPITVHYNLPTSCHYFNYLYYDKNLNVRTIAIESAVAQQDNCTETPNDASSYTFDFYVTSNGSYIFKFYQGQDANGENIFLEYEIPVTNKK